MIAPAGNGPRPLRAGGQLDTGAGVPSNFPRMTAPAEPFPSDAVRELRGETLLRGLHRLAPLGRKYHPILRLLNGQHGLLAIPFENYRVIQPAAWSKEITNQLLRGLDVIPEFRLLSPLCRSLNTGCLVDVGANLGLYTLMLRSVSALPLIAYEPQPFLFKLLEWNVACNRLQNVRTRNVACGARSGHVPFTIGINGSVAAEVLRSNRPAGRECLAASDWVAEAQATRAGETVVNVPLATLDEDLAGEADIALLKIDCEGFEHDILRGAMQVIERHAPRLFLEVHPALLERFGHSVAEVLELLRPHYDLEFWCFEPMRHRTKLERSLAKFRRPEGRRYADADEMLAAANSEARPAQMYFVGQPRRHKVGPLT